MDRENRCLNREDRYSVKREVREFLKSGITDTHSSFTDEYEEHISSMINLLDEAVLIHDDGLIRYANKAALKLFNVDDARELYGRDIGKLIYLDSGNSVKETDAAYHDYEYKPLKIWIKREGEEPIEGEMISSVPVPSGQKLVQSIIYNVSERHKIMAELEKASRLNLLSTIAGGVAHDFNNFLAIMLGNISLCRKKLGGNETVYSMMNNIENSIIRAKELANQLLFYAQDGSPTQKVAPLGKLVKDITDFALRGTSVHGEVHVSEKIGPVKINDNQIAEVMNNLIINAVQAMPHGGKIYVQAENLPADRIDNTIPLHFSGKELVKISVRDEGMGIPEKIREKIFDQFITTKPNGAGLGLSTSYRIIKNNHGDMNFQSQPGEGTTFNIYLPVCKDDRSYQKEKNKTEITMGQGRVLVMDDLEPMRKLTGEMLNLLGYDVEYAADGAEAIMLYKKSMQRAAPYDVVLMDMAIPGGMNGTAAIKGLLEIDPEAKVVMVSGYDCAEYISQYFYHDFKGFLQKPFRIGELAEMLKEVLAANRE